MSDYPSDGRKTRPGEYREGGGNPEWDDEQQPWCGPSAEWSERHDPVISAVRAFIETTESDTGVPFMRMVNAFNDYDARIIAEAAPQEPPPDVEFYADVDFPPTPRTRLVSRRRTDDERHAASIVAAVAAEAAVAEPTEAPKPTSGDSKNIPHWTFREHWRSPFWAWKRGGQEIANAAMKKGKI